MNNAETKAKQIIKTTAIKSKCKKITANSRDYLPKIRLLVMSKSFYNNARAYLKNHFRNLHFSNTLQCQMQKVGGQCNDNKKAI